MSPHPHLYYWTIGLGTGLDNFTLTFDDPDSTYLMHRNSKSLSRIILKPPKSLNLYNLLCVCTMCIMLCLNNM